jgi:hypothetical protein
LSPRAEGGPSKRRCYSSPQSDRSVSMLKRRSDDSDGPDIRCIDFALGVGL